MSNMALTDLVKSLLDLAPCLSMEDLWKDATIFIGFYYPIWHLLPNIVSFMEFSFFLTRDIPYCHWIIPLTEYRCGSNGYWSKIFHFKTLSVSSNWSPRLIVYGDLGLINGQSIPRLRQEVENETADLIIHAGIATNTKSILSFSNQFRFSN